MKKILPLLSLSLLLTGCGPKEYLLNEQTFFLVMTNILYYPESYVDSRITADVFTYEIKTVDEQSYIVGVRKCSSAYGCKCGKDTIIGFILNYDGEIPAPTNQYENSNDKTWIHIDGKLAGKDKTNLQIFGADGKTAETVQFLSFNVSNLSMIEDYTNLHYYVDK